MFIELKRLVGCLDDARAAMVSMRLIIEMLVKESCLKNGIEISLKNRSKKLHELINLTKHGFPKKYDDLIKDIKPIADNSVHYDVVKKYFYLSEDDLKDLFNKLLELSSFYIRKFGL